MITFDINTLNAFIDEQSDFFKGARLNKIQQPTRREFVFTLRNQSKSRQFYINITPEFYHLCFPSKENYEKRHISIPQKPPMFCMLLRKHLENSRIAKVLQPDNERILELYIETYNELGEKIYLCLSIELMGKHSNVILYNCDTGVILGCAHNVGAEKSRLREIYGGIPYIYPPKQEGNSNSWTSLLDTVQVKTTVNDMIDDYYAEQIYQNKFKSLKSQYKTLITQKLKKVQKAINQMEYKLNKNSDYDKYRLYGDLLMANLYQLKDFQNTASVYDYENNSQIEIPLDNLKSIKDNANKYYKLYNKGKTAGIKIEELYNQAMQKKEYFEQSLFSVDTAQTIEELLEIASEPGLITTQSGLSKEKNTKNSKNKINIMNIKLDDGGQIFIGKNNKQNDYIISKLAKDEDLWFHVHNCAGSHILLKSHNITDDLILKCAKLAKEYSTAKETSKVGVIYTKRKYLRKPPGANLGYVTYRNEKEIVLD